MADPLGMTDPEDPRYQDYVKQVQTAVIDAIGTLDPAGQGYLYPGLIEGLCMVIAGAAHDFRFVDTPRDRRNSVKSIAETIDRRMRVLQANDTRPR